MHQLARLLADAAQRQERSFGMDAGFLLELADGCRQRILTILHQALRDGPGTQIAPAPEWPAGMGEEDPQSLPGTAKQEQPGAYVLALQRAHTSGAYMVSLSTLSFAVSV